MTIQTLNIDYFKKLQTTYVFTFVQWQLEKFYFQKILHFGEFVNNRSLIFLYFYKLRYRCSSNLSVETSPILNIEYFQKIIVFIFLNLSNGCMNNKYIFKKYYLLVNWWVLKVN